MGVAERASVRLPHRAARSPPSVLEAVSHARPSRRESTSPQASSSGARPSANSPPARAYMSDSRRDTSSASSHRSARRRSAEKVSRPRRTRARRSGRPSAALHTDRQWCRAHSATASPACPEGGSSSSRRTAAGTHLSIWEISCIMLMPRGRPCGLFPSPPGAEALSGPGGP